MVEIPAEPSPVSAYLSRPKKQANPLAALLVLHENRGLTPHIKDVTRRAARADFVAVGVDLLSRQGGSEKFPDPNDARQAYGKTTAEGRLADMLAAVGWMKQQPFIKADRIGVVGFCAGGANTFSIDPRSTGTSKASDNRAMPMAPSVMERCQDRALGKSLRGSSNSGIRRLTKHTPLAVKRTQSWL